MHTEFIITKNGPILIEVNPRLGGAMIGKMISCAYKFNFYEAILQLTLGKNPTIPDKPNKAATEYYLYPNVKGTITNVSDIARTCPGAISITQHIKKNHYMGPPTNYRSKAIASILTEGNSTTHSITNALQP